MFGQPKKKEEKAIEKKDTNKKEGYFTSDIRVTLISTVVGIVIGYISYLLNSPAVALGITVVVGAIAGFAMKKGLGIKEDSKWWVSNYVVTYVLVWFVVWTIFYNTVIL